MKCSWRRMLRFYNDIFGFVSPIFRCFVRSILIFTARKRSLRRLCFHRCLSVHGGGGLYGGVSIQGGLCPREGSLSKGGVSVQGRGLCPGEGSLSRGGVSVQGGLCPGEGSLSRGGVSVQGRGLCPGEGSLSRGGLCQWDPPYGYVRVVRILLECILVNWRITNVIVESC